MIFYIFYILEIYNIKYNNVKYIKNNHIYY